VVTNMNFKEHRKAANERMVEISEYIDKDDEAARLQGTGLAGVLVGGWVAALSASLGFNPLTTAILITIGVGSGIAARTMI